MRVFRGGGGHSHGELTESVVSRSHRTHTAPPVAPGTAICRFGPWADYHIVYTSWDGRLIELDTITGELHDHSARFKVCMCVGRVCNRTHMARWWTGMVFLSFAH